jgi:predicted GNAT family N-acyltransferase
VTDRAPADAAARFSVVVVTPADPRYHAARDVRFSALYEPWGLPIRLVDDADGLEYVHFVAVAEDGSVVGYARLHLQGGESKAYQVAVDEPWRARGVGRALMAAVAERARAEGRDRLHLDARVYAIPFYERLGFTAEGDTFISGRTGTPHRRMHRPL